jgi:hypothetical protein
MTDCRHPCRAVRTACRSRSRFYVAQKLYRSQARAASFRRDAPTRPAPITTATEALRKSPVAPLTKTVSPASRLAARKPLYERHWVPSAPWSRLLLVECANTFSVGTRVCSATSPVAEVLLQTQAAFAGRGARSRESASSREPTVQSQFDPSRRVQGVSRPVRRRACGRFRGVLGPRPSRGGNLTLVRCELVRGGKPHADPVPRDARSLAGDSLVLDLLQRL